MSDLESLFTHHPKRNYHAALVEGLPKSAENITTRAYAVVGGEFQEVMVERVDKYRGLEPDQVLLIKDFILDDMTAANTRRVDVPAPMAGVIGRVDAPNGVVDICDPAGGRLLARIRHLGPIAVEAGEDVVYGQSLGTQSNLGLQRTAGKHVHIEMDTRYHQQFDHYMLDLVEGRLPVQAEHRAGVEPRAVVDDGIQRVGEAGARVAAVQRALVAGGYRAVHDAAIPVDGVYRLSMQGAVLQFQHDNGLDPSGDIDATTWRQALDLTLGKPTLPPPVVDGPPGVQSTAKDGLLDRIRGRVGALDAVDGLPLTDGQRERMAHSLAGLAAGHRLQSVDHVLLGAAPGGAAGERVFVVQGRLDDPAQRRAWMSTFEAINTPVADSLARLQGFRERAESSARQPDLAAHAHQPESALTSMRHGQPA
ncbi:peptidoglycan-binding domain-containing protein [Luteimonas changyuni]|uniref:peptidoglycan-binding domain-containing protein n=1 Tax=Luteimonas sp. MJ145 TaxID=3129234 RepID=UPI0031BB9603